MSAKLLLSLGLIAAVATGCTNVAQESKPAASTAPAAAAPAAASGPVKLVDFKVEKGNQIMTSLTGKPGNPEAGIKVMVDTRGGNCLACHQVTALKKEPFHGNVGPSLDGVASRYTVAELRGLVVNPKNTNPDTIMPAFYKNDGFKNVAKARAGQPILSAEQVEDVLAFLQTLK